MSTEPRTMLESINGQEIYKRLQVHRQNMYSCTLDPIEAKWLLDIIDELAAPTTPSVSPAQPVAVVDEDDSGLFADILMNQDGYTSLKMGDKLYAHPPVATPAQSVSPVGGAGDLGKQLNHAIRTSDAATRWDQAYAFLKTEVQRAVKELESAGAARSSGGGEAAEVLAFLKATEQWEANVIMEDSAWNTPAAHPWLTDELYDEWMELQAMRNELMDKFAALRSIQVGGVEAGPAWRMVADKLPKPFDRVRIAGPEITTYYLGGPIYHPLGEAYITSAGEWRWGYSEKPIGFVPACWLDYPDAPMPLVALLCPSDLPAPTQDESQKGGVEGE